MVSIKDLVKGTTAQFQSYRNGVFFYTIECPVDNQTYQFQVAADSIEGASVERDMKALHLMRWIRKNQSAGTLVQLR